MLEYLKVKWENSHALSQNYCWKLFWYFILVLRLILRLFFLYFTGQGYLESKVSKYQITWSSLVLHNKSHGKTTMSRLQNPTKRDYVRSYMSGSYGNIFCLDDLWFMKTWMWGTGYRLKDTDFGNISELVLGEELKKGIYPPQQKSLPPCPNF